MAPREVTFRTLRRIFLWEIFSGPGRASGAVDCVNERNPDDCKRADICVTRTIWAKVRDRIAEVLDSYSLLDLVKEARNMPGNEASRCQ